jgi:ketosteroid isomerase-like protein
VLFVQNHGVLHWAQPFEASSGMGAISQEAHTKEGMMKWFTKIAVAISLMIAGPVAHAQTTDTKADIQKSADEYMSAYNKKDAATIAKMYADNAVFSGPGWTASSRAAIQDGLTKEIASGAFSRLTAITVDQSRRVADMNYASGSWSADMKGPDGKDMPVSGHWLVVSEYKNGVYTALVHNTNMAMPPPK